MRKIVLPNASLVEMDWSDRFYSNCGVGFYKLFASDMALLMHDFYFPVVIRLPC